MPSRRLPLGTLKQCRTWREKVLAVCSRCRRLLTLSTNSRVRLKGSCDDGGDVQEPICALPQATQHGAPADRLNRGVFENQFRADHCTASERRTRSRRLSFTVGRYYLCSGTLLEDGPGCRPSRSDKAFWCGALFWQRHTPKPCTAHAERTAVDWAWMAPPAGGAS